MSDNHPEHARLRAQVRAAERLIKACSAHIEAETKAGFRPDQPRIPPGQGRVSGRWGDGLMAAAATIGRVLRDDLKSLARAVNLPMKLASHAVEEAIAHAPPQVQAFLEANRTAITRSLGALQAAGGLAEGLVGATTFTAGAATAETGVGIGVAAAGAWMTARGYDDWNTGLKALVSGDPQETGFYRSLRDFGFSDDEAQGILVSTSGLSAAAAAKLPRLALEQAADRALVGDALSAFPDRALDIKVDGKPIWSTADIARRGDAWEAYDAAQTGLQRTPPGFPAFDQTNSDGSIVVSNKTLDLQRDFYNKISPSTVNNRIKKMVDDAADFKKGVRGQVRIYNDDIIERSVHLLLPAGRPTPGQASQIKAATEYANTRSVKLKIFYAN